jgi:phosphatidylserine/phosphatidylglycerophosphate/cardiolipin synthase-like enzyme
LDELVNAARVCSFAVYKAQNIMSVLEKAAERRAEIMVILESLDVHHPCSGRMPNAKPLRRTRLAPCMAKIGVADGSILYLCGANLIDCAMNVNMEMGVLVRDKELPRTGQHFEEWITNAIPAGIAEE